MIQFRLILFHPGIGMFYLTFYSATETREHFASKSVHLLGTKLVLFFKVYSGIYLSKLIYFFVRNCYWVLQSMSLFRVPSFGITSKRVNLPLFFKGRGMGFREQFDNLIVRCHLQLWHLLFPYEWKWATWQMTIF